MKSLQYFLLVHLGVGYWIFWAGLSDDFAHIPSVAIPRLVLAFTLGPEMFISMWLIAFIYNRTYKYNWPACYYRIVDRDGTKPQEDAP